MAGSGKIGCFILRCLTRPLAVLPLGFHRSCGRLLGRMAGNLFRYRRDVVMINLARSFPEKHYSELQEICRRSYAHFGKLIAEAIWFGGSSPKRLRRSGVARIDDVSLINGCFDKGKSVIVMGSHCGNWELFGGYRFYTDEPFKYDELNMCVVYRRLTSPAWERFMKKNRLAAVTDRKHYDGMVESFRLMRYVLEHKDRNMFYNIVTDQFPYSDSFRVKVRDFMGQETWSMGGATALAHKLGMAVFYLRMKENQDGNYSISFIPICEDAREMDSVEILDRYYALLEEDLREQPWNYLWTHKRWK